MSAQASGCPEQLGHYEEECYLCRPLLPADSQEDDVQFCQRLTKEAGVTPIPVRRNCETARRCCYGSCNHGLQCAGEYDFSSIDFIAWDMQASAFYAGADPPRSLVRFCFCKDDSKLERACTALWKYFSGTKE